MTSSGSHRFSLAPGPLNGLDGPGKKSCHLVKHEMVQSCAEIISLAHLVTVQGNLGQIDRALFRKKSNSWRLNDLQVPRPRIEITRKSFSYQGAKVWNDIPNNIRDVESISIFKKQLRNYLLGQ